VLNGTGTFELEPRRRRDGPRRDDVLARACPGSSPSATAACWATPTPTTSARAAPTASASRTRSTSPAAHGQGIGKLLLAELIAQCEARGARQMLAVIGDSANAGSIGVHRALGFEHTGS
jgi:phosphinothricin acetyltransferase